MIHRIPSTLLERPVNVDLVGVGGNGCQMLTGLARLDRALRVLGHPGGLHVRAWDPDRVSEANIGRQLFSPADIGDNKATVLITRLNHFFGLRWEAKPERFAGFRPSIEDWSFKCHFLITCVDSAKARREIHHAISGHTHGSQNTPTYWLDLGNRQADGQVILGEPFEKVNGPRKDTAQNPRLPTVTEIFPELLDEKLAEDNRPSCSLAEALETQDLFVNQHVATWALQLLWTLFRQGQIRHHGAFINLMDGSVNPLPVPAQVAVAEKTTRKRRAA